MVSTLQHYNRLSTRLAGGSSPARNNCDLPQAAAPHLLRSFPAIGSLIPANRAVFHRTRGQWTRGLQRLVLCAVLGFGAAYGGANLAAAENASSFDGPVSAHPDLQRAGDNRAVEEILQDLSLKFGGFDSRIIEPLLIHAAAFQETRQHESALLFLDRAWQVSRRAFGFYNESLVTLLEAMIYNNLELKDWEEVDRNFAYLETLYTHLYEPSDPRLEEGLRQVSSWHVNAANLNIDNRSTSHLLAARQVFMKRLESAKQLRAADDPLIDYLQDGLAIAEYNLRAIKRERHAAAYSEVPFTREPLWADSGRIRPR